jgi:NAD(P)-dependent dehydrogenase (short-subunit alcohol dehydrogenase family)
MKKPYAVCAVYRSNPPEVDSQEMRQVDPLQPRAREHNIYVVKADLTKEGQLDRIVELTLARFGKIDVLINNAVLYSMGSMVETQNLLKQATNAFEINTLVPLRLAVQATQMFWRNRRQENINANRNVINVSSISGLKLYEGMGQSVYSASKAALNCLTVHMASEFSDFGVRVNAIAPTNFPGIISTESVVQQILRIDKSTMNGTVMVLDPET